MGFFENLERLSYGIKVWAIKLNSKTNKFTKTNTHETNCHHGNKYVLCATRPEEMSQVNALKMEQQPITRITNTRIFTSGTGYKRFEI